MAPLPLIMDCLGETRRAAYGRREGSAVDGCVIDGRRVRAAPGALRVFFEPVLAAEVNSERGGEREGCHAEQYSVRTGLAHDSAGTAERIDDAWVT